MDGLIAFKILLCVQNTLIYKFIVEFHQCFLSKLCSFHLFDYLICYQFIDTFGDSHYCHETTGIIGVSNLIFLFT